MNYLLHLILGASLLLAVAEAVAFGWLTVDNYFSIKNDEPTTETYKFIMLFTASLAVAAYVAKALS